jgi:hypothetical protein
MTLTAPNALSARKCATECVGLIAETLGRSVAESLLPAFLHAAAEGFALDAPMLREYGHGLFAVSARVLKESFVPFLDGCVKFARTSIQSVRLPSLLHLRLSLISQRNAVGNKRRSFSRTVCTVSSIRAVNSTFWGCLYVQALLL